MTNSGIGPVQPLLTHEAGLAARSRETLDRREAFERNHPQIKISTRRDGTKLVFDVSAPDCAEVTYQDGKAMMDDLEKRYPC